MSMNTHLMKMKMKTKMNRWELDKELDRLKQQGFSEEQIYCILACMEKENEEYYYDTKTITR